MKILVSFALCLLLLASCRMPTDLGIQEPNGSLRKVEAASPESGLKETYFVKGAEGAKEVREGIYKSWYPNGKIYVEANFKNDQLDGKCVIHRSDGAPPFVGWWRDGKPWSGTVQDGHLLARYHNGKKIGDIEG